MRRGPAARRRRHGRQRLALPIPGRHPGPTGRAPGGHRDHGPGRGLSRRPRHGRLRLARGHRRQPGAARSASSRASTTAPAPPVSPAGSRPSRACSRGPDAPAPRHLQRRESRRPGRPRSAAGVTDRGPAARSSCASTPISCACRRCMVRSARAGRRANYWRSTGSSSRRPMRVPSSPPPTAAAIILAHPGWPTSTISSS